MNNALKVFLILVIIFPFSGCRGKQKNETFKSVDCTVFYGNLRSIKVLGNGKAYIRYDKRKSFDKNLHEKSELYSIILEKNQMDSISGMVTVLLGAGIESLEESTGNNGVSVSLIINPNDKTLPARSENNAVKDYRPAYHLVNYLDELSQNVKSVMDTTFVFESRKFLKNRAYATDHGL